MLNAQDGKKSKMAEHKTLYNPTSINFADLFPDLGHSDLLPPHRNSSTSWSATKKGNT